MPNTIAQVVVDLPVEGSFDYEIPPAFLGKLAVGQRVLVSFQTKTLIGYVVALKANSVFKRLKPIISVLDQHPVLSEGMLALAEDFSKDYCCSLGQAIATFFPSSFKKTKKEISFSLPTLKEPKGMEAEKAETLFIQDRTLKSFWVVIAEHLQRVLAQGMSAIILVPEADRINAAINGLKDAGIDESFLILDKQLSDKKQLEAWILAKEGKVRVLLGTRSAIFAPAASLGLIIVVDESNFSYKQDQSPFYHARRVAFLRAQQDKAQLIFAGRSPSLELYHLIEKKKIMFVDLPRADDPCVSQMVDMTNYKYGKSHLLSIPLSHALEKILAEKGKALLVMNKKGFGSFGVCAKCQHVLECPRCSVPLTFLYESKQVVCRYCNHRAVYSPVCPQCHGSYLHFSGMGIERLESEVSRFFPSARVQCYDKESQACPKDFDVLVATQAIVRLDDRFRFDLTCVVKIDAELNRLDFEASENTFSFLIHLKAMTSGKLLIQTHLRDNYCLQALTEDKPLVFYKKELALRRELGFPPFMHMAEIVLRSMDQGAAAKQADILFNALKLQESKGLEILPAQILSLARLRDQYRFVIVAKGRSRVTLTAAIRKALALVARASKVITTVNMIP